MQEELRKKYEDGAWLSATQTIDAFLQSGEVDKAIEFAGEAIKNWEMEDKTEIIERFNGWLKERDITIN